MADHGYFFWGVLGGRGIRNIEYSICNKITGHMQSKHATPAL